MFFYVSEAPAMRIEVCTMGKLLPLLALCVLLFPVDVTLLLLGCVVLRKSIHVTLRLGPRSVFSRFNFLVMVT